MEIDWRRFVIERLPMRMRKRMMQGICMVMTEPVVRLHGEFSLWKKRMEMSAGSGAQVCMLKRLVRDSLGIDVEIVEGDGKPFDFVVQTGFTDVDKERQLFSLLNRYKLAGKSYRYENREVRYDVTWTGMVCEKRMPGYDTRWSGFVCEKGNGDRVNRITMTYYWEFDAEYGANIMRRVEMRAAEEMGSDVKILADMYVVGQREPVKPEFVLKKGENYLSVKTWVMDRHEHERVSPRADYDWSYELIIKDVYE